MRVMGGGEVGGRCKGRARRLGLLIRVLKSHVGIIHERLILYFVHHVT